jgi:hypothetical protein
VIPLLKVGISVDVSSAKDHAVGVDAATRSSQTLAIVHHITSLVPSALHDLNAHGATDPVDHSARKSSPVPALLTTCTQYANRHAILIELTESIFDPALYEAFARPNHSM